MKWITRERPKIDRIACPWLIKRFVDNEAEFIYVPFDQVIIKSKELKATPFDLPDVEYTHYGDQCTFDYIISKHKLTDPVLKVMAVIVRGADTDRHDIASQSSGLWAISAGLSENIQDDQQLLAKGMMIYEALYTWAKHLQKVKHTQNPIENLLLNVYKKFLKQKSGTRKIPAWAK
ncbi:MAG: chromate resistance protein ChrB domain-containing protein [Cyclobacteriaceae bacterium]